MHTSSSSKAVAAFGSGAWPAMARERAPCLPPRFAIALMRPLQAAKLGRVMSAVYRSQRCATCLNLQALSAVDGHTCNDIWKCQRQMSQLRVSFES